MALLTCREERTLFNVALISPPGFSRQIVALLQALEADFSSFNILADDEVRQGTTVP